MDVWLFLPLSNFSVLILIFVFFWQNIIQRFIIKWLRHFLFVVHELSELHEFESHFVRH